MPVISGVTLFIHDSEENIHIRPVFRFGFGWFYGAHLQNRLSLL